MFDSDKPIQKSSEDRLNRTVFAKYLARCILDHQSPESLVIGLAGESGVGKTSIINLALEELNYAAGNMFDEEKPIILNFSPWSYSGQKQLIYSFFRRLSAEIRRFPHLANKDRIIHLLELYVSFFTHQPIPKIYRAKKNIFKKLFSREKEAIIGWEAGRDLTQVKAELNELLSQQKHKIIIIIDNISRIEEEEIKQIFQITKSMGDFANTVYLLSFDKSHILNAIQKFHGGNAQEFLDKIIQLPFTVPFINAQDLENILFDRLEKIVALAPEGRWSTEYWADLYYSTLRHLFKNCRDITRYVNTLSFSFSRIKDIVNPVDFFALTAIEVFEPDVYYGIRANKDLFTDLVENVYPTDDEHIREDKSRCDEIINRSKTIFKDDLKTLLIKIFPRLRSIYHRNEEFYHSQALARKNLRICSPDMFDIYFRLSLPSGCIPEAEFDAILALAKDQEGFTQALIRLNQDERAAKFLDLLDSDKIQKIPKEHIPHVINALLEVADLVPETENSLLRPTTSQRVHRIIHQLLRRFDSSDKRFQLLKEAIQKETKSLYAGIHELIEEEREHVEDEDTFVPLEHRDLTTEQLEKLQSLEIEKIKFWAENGSLEKHPKLLSILYAWKNWGDSDGCKNYVEEMIKTDRGIVYFLNSALHDPIEEAITKLHRSSNWENYLKNIEDFIPPKQLEQHAREIFEDLYFEKLSERDQLAIMIFLDLIHADTTKVIPKTTV